MQQPRSPLTSTVSPPRSPQPILSNGQPYVSSGYPTAVTPAVRPATYVGGQHTVVSSQTIVGGQNPAVAGQPQMISRPTVIQAPPVYMQPATQGVPSATSMSSNVYRPQAARTVYVQGAAPTYTQASPAGQPMTTTVIRGAAPGQPVVRTVVPASTLSTPLLSSSQAGAAQNRPHTSAGPGYTQAAYEAKHQDDPQLQNLKELRRTSGLKNVPVGDGLETLKAVAVDGKLSRDQFVAGYAQLLQGHSVECPTLEVQNAVFDLFDRDDNNVVDMMELICGISLLCSGSEDDKIHAVFNVFDENGDGFISMDEMFKFLTSVFKVVLTPNVMGVMNSMGVTVDSPEDLASVTALECFKTADLNHDGKLSVIEFKNWFYAPRNDPSFLFSPVRKLLQ